MVHYVQERLEEENLEEEIAEEEETIACENCHISYVKSELIIENVSEGIYYHCPSCGAVVKETVELVEEQEEEEKYREIPIYIESENPCLWYVDYEPSIATVSNYFDEQQTCEAVTEKDINYYIYFYQKLSSGEIIKKSRKIERSFLSITILDNLDLLIEESEEPTPEVPEEVLDEYVCPRCARRVLYEINESHNCPYCGYPAEEEIEEIPEEEIEEIPEEEAIEEGE